MFRSTSRLTTRLSGVKFYNPIGRRLTPFNYQFSRKITNAFQNGRMPPPGMAQAPLPPQSKVRPYRWLIILTLAIAVSGGAFKYYTAHNYPSEVATKLRKALRAELDGGGKGKPDYKLALQYYLEALEEADNSELHYLSDEYTGLQIKIAEMYEKLGMNEEARLLYRELGTSYLQALADGTTISPNVRPHMIQRDLRVALKTAIFEATTHPEIAKMGLIVHFVLAQNEVASRDPAIAELMNHERDRTHFKLSLPLEPESGKVDTTAWQPFRDELFSARDMFVALCLATGDIGFAIDTKLATTHWMSLAGCDIGETLMSFYNVGSIFYLQSEQFELREAQFSKDETKTPEEVTEVKQLAEESMGYSTSCFDAIVKLVEKLPSKTRREANVAEVHALSTYGLGVIALHRGQYDKSRDLLRESRLRAKGCNFEELVSSSELELQKLDKILEEISKGEENPKYEPPSMDVLFLKADNKEDPVALKTPKDFSPSNSDDTTNSK